MAILTCGANELEVNWVNGLTVQQMRQSSRYAGLVRTLDIQEGSVVELYDDTDDSWVEASNDDPIGADDNLRFATTGGVKGSITQ